MIKGIIVSSYDEYLRASAARMAEWSHIYCHGSWQYLKSLNLVSNPRWHEAFFINTIGAQAIKVNTPKILISGTADEGTLDVVFQALNQSELSNYQITVLDSCATPLLANQYYGARLGQRLTTVQGDALNMPFSGQQFNMIVTDAFLTRFDSKDKPRVVSEWYRILENRGQVITTARLLNGSIPMSADERKYTIASYVARALVKAKANGLDPDLIKSLATEYAERMKSNPFSNLEELNNLFARFSKVRIFHPVPTIGELRPALYAQILAEKVIL